MDASSGGSSPSEGWREGSQRRERQSEEREAAVSMSDGAAAAEVA